MTQPFERSTSPDERGQVTGPTLHTPLSLLVHNLPDPPTDEEVERIARKLGAPIDRLEPQDN